MNKLDACVGQTGPLCFLSCDVLCCAVLPSLELLGSAAVVE